MGFIHSGKLKRRGLICAFHSVNVLTCEHGQGVNALVNERGRVDVERRVIVVHRMEPCVVDVLVLVRENREVVPGGEAILRWYLAHGQGHHERGREN